MNVMITGATGFVGRALVQRLLARGQRPVALVRNPQLARSRLGPDVEMVDSSDRGALARAVAAADSIVNLAGEPVLTRLTRSKRERVISSRVGLTRTLVQAIAGAPSRPKVLVSASAIGYYGSRGSDAIGEDAAAGTGFLAGLCADWEAAAREAEPHGVRVVLLRIGVVLGSDGGALGQMIPAFKLGLGGKIGSGHQVMSWIHLDDLVQMILTTMEDARWRGPVNATAPHPVTNAEFTRALGRAVSRVTPIPVPAFVLRLALGEAAEILTGGQRVVPQAASSWQFQFRYPQLDAALDAALRPERSVSICRATALPASGYLEKRGATYQLHQELHVPAGLERVMRFFSRAENLGLVTPAWLSWRIEGDPPTAVEPGTIIDYSIGLGPFRMGWRTVIEVVEPSRRFADAQHRGPYRSWWHEHAFAADGPGTRVIDDVYYSLPLGVIGRLVHFVAVGPLLKRIFAYRQEAIARLFEGGS